jgi:hypothetical protein
MTSNQTKQWWEVTELARCAVDTSLSAEGVVERAALFGNTLTVEEVTESRAAFHKGNMEAEGSMRGSLRKGILPKK